VAARSRRPRRRPSATSPEDRVRVGVMS
jgi:hypothetical protein